MFKEPAAQAASALRKGKPQTSKPTTSKSGAAPVPKTAEPMVPLSENPGLSMDNPFIEIILEEQYEEIFESEHREPGTSSSRARGASSAKGVQPINPLSTNSGMSMNNPFIQSAVEEHFEDVFEPLYIEVPLRISESTKNASPQIGPLRGPEPPLEATPSDELEVGKLKKGMIGVGRGLTELGQGIKQLGLNIGEGLGLVEEGTAAKYTSSINDETKLYDSTEVGQSTIAKVAGVATEIGLAIAVPEAAAAKGATYVASTFASGAALGALKPTEEGTLASHVKNAVVEASMSVAAAGAGKAVLHAYSKGKHGISSFTEKVLTSTWLSKGYNANSKSFTPAFNQIESFSTKGTLDGALYPKDKLALLVNYLEKRGTYVYGTKGAPRFVGRINGASQIYLPENPTILQVKHELSHWLDFKNLGYEKYSKLTVYQRENMVLERLQENRIWSELNQFEKDFSLNYVEKIKDGYKPGVRYE